MTQSDNDPAPIMGTLEVAGYRGDDPASVDAARADARAGWAHGAPGILVRRQDLEAQLAASGAGPDDLVLVRIHAVHPRALTASEN